MERSSLFIILVLGNVVTVLTFYFFTNTHKNEILSLNTTITELKAKIYQLIENVTPKDPSYFVTLKVNGDGDKASAGKTSKIKLYALGRPSIDPDWANVAIFGDHNFVTIGVEQGEMQNFNSILSALSIDLDCSSDNNSSPSPSCWTLTACTRPLTGIESQYCYNLPLEDSRRYFLPPNITHVYIQNNKYRASFLMSAIYDISPSNFDASHQKGSYYFCYGLPGGVIKKTTTQCPPCLCASVFSGRTLRTQLMLGEESVLADVNKLANILLKNSRFIACLKKNETSIESPRDVYLVGDVPTMPAANIWGVRELFARNGMPLMLEGGTLLGWYRNCSIVWDDVDVDFDVPNWAVNEEFYKKILTSAYGHNEPVIETVSKPNSYYLNQNVTVTDLGEQSWLKTTRVFGDLKSGVEVRYEAWISRDGGSTWDKPIVGVDVFVLYLNLPGINYNYVQGFLSWQHQILHYALPKNLTLCSTIFLGDLYLVPCEPAGVLHSHYGPGWRYPEARKDNYWSQQPNIIRRIKIDDREWKKRVMVRTFGSDR